MKTHVWNAIHHLLLLVISLTGVVVITRFLGLHETYLVNQISEISLIVIALALDLSVVDHNQKKAQRAEKE